MKRVEVYRIGNSDNLAIYTVDSNTELTLIEAERVAQDLLNICQDIRQEEKDWQEFPAWRKGKKEK